ncbi:dihydroorotate dehydrogenase [Treponema rectale]|uniref:Dihydroorotate dehydrogenase n=1 Tax=Treponema rectale TaxID=744512 RepID=A0A840SI54_9SPIR|nr:dihydroorotate dehydrogenase [Treponema rectale]MBB5219091.1 dihydroorotate dehydrogenase (NAD+) catalytic subunit [Treponema rectale]QOS41007.1 dihydroorotate dehydrogenase [Treponema rectale]
MDAPEIDENGKGILYAQKADVSFVKKIEGQSNVYLLEVLTAVEKNQISSRPGQFYMIKGSVSGVQFGRPISVYNSTEGTVPASEKKLLKIQFMILEKGEGTKELCHLKPNDKIDITGPLGNCFTLPQDIYALESDRPQIAIVGGGIGVAPVANFASSLTPKSYDFFASFKSKTYGLENIKAQNLIITTDDGSEGIHGMLSAALTEEKIKAAGYKVIFACGPMPMLSYVKDIAEKCGIKSYLSLEKKMLCGAGACLGCTIQTKIGNRRVCKDGPIFEGSILDFDLLRSQIPSAHKNHCLENKEPDLKVKIAGVEFKNPVIAASGTFGFGQNYRGFFDVSRIGGISSKGLTLNPKPGNEGERIIEITGGDINSIGLENPGVPSFIENELPRMLSLDTTTIANLAGSDLESYVEGAKLLDKTDVPMIELNISCPNVKHGGMAWGTEPEAAYECVSAVRKATSKPLMVKLSPNAPDLVAVALSCIKAGADALSLINTIQAVAIDIEKARPYFNNVKAGMCGPAVKPIALRMVYDVCSAIKKLPESEQVPVVGLGGISRWQDAVEFIMAGADAVQVGSATFSNPNAMCEIVDGLTAFMKSHGYSSIAEMKGLAL